jgi:hypothetical protein
MQGVLSPTSVTSTAHQDENRSDVQQSCQPFVQCNRLCISKDNCKPSNHASKLTYLFQSLPTYRLMPQIFQTF